MTQEYVRILDSEKSFGAKNLLQCQVFLLNTIRNIREYNSAREEELAAKILLRKKLAEIEDKLKVLEKVMPKVKKEDEEKAEKKTSVKKRMDLESEIEEIRRRIDRIS